MFLGQHPLTCLPHYSPSAFRSFLGDENGHFASSSSGSDTTNSGSLPLPMLDVYRSAATGVQSMVTKGLSTGGGGHQSKSGPMTSPQQSISSSASAAAVNRLMMSNSQAMTMPDPVPSELEIRESSVQPGSSGIWSRTKLSIGRRFGPLTSVISDGNLTLKEKDVRKMSSWARHIRVQQDDQVACSSPNLAAVVVTNLVYFVVIRELDIGEELVLINSDVIFTENELNGLFQKSKELVVCEHCEEAFGGQDEVARHKCCNRDVIKAASSEQEKHLGAVVVNSTTPTSSNSTVTNNSETLDCPVCDLTFTSPQRLEEHCLCAHSNNDSDQGDQRCEYRCRKCPKTFNWKSNLVRHQLGHDDGRNYACENCTKVFTDPSNLQRHIRSQHIGARSHACPECGKTFATSSGLKQHTHIHSSVKPFQCEVCLKAYTQFSNLCRHKRMHATCRMQVKCHKCGQAFSTVTSLSKHKRFCEGASSQPNQFSNGNIQSDKNFTVTGATSNNSPLVNANPMNISSQQAPAGGVANSTSNPLAFYPRQGFPFYHPSLLGYPLFPGNPLTNQSVNNALLQLATSSKNDLGNEFTHSDPNRLRNGLLAIAEPTKIKKESSVGSESEISEEIASSAGTDSELGSDAEFSEKSKQDSEDMFSTHRQGSPKQASVCPASTPVPTNDRICAYSPRISASGSYDNEMPFDLSSNKKFRRSKEAVLPDRVASLNGQITTDDQPLDLRVTQRKGDSSFNVHSDDDLKHKIHVSSESVRSEGSQTPTTPTSPSTPNSFNQVDSTSPSPVSPNKLSMVYPRPLHPMLLESMYRLQPKFNFPTSPDRYVSPFSSPRFPYMNPLLNSNPSAFELMKSQMERLGKPFPEMLSPHLNKAKERYSCKFCGKVFPRSANLTRHLRTHTGEQPYKCKYCERSFSISSNLQRHVRNIHNKEKPFKCPLCDRCFGQQTNLDRHLKKHESDGPTIMDSPKHGDMDEGSNKDETYFDEIRNFMGKVTNVAAHHPTAHYLHQAFPEHVVKHRSTSLTSDQPSPPNAMSLTDEECPEEAEPIIKKSLENGATVSSGSDCDKDCDLDRPSSGGSDATSPGSLKKRMEYRYQRESDCNNDEL